MATMPLKLLATSIFAVIATQNATANTGDTLQTITISVGEDNSRADKGQEGSVYAQESQPMQQATHLSNFMHDVPGVDIGGTSTMDQHIYIRGVDDKNLKITVDGARQENYFFHHAGNIAIDTEMYKAAEVSVGNNSVTLGNNASGGAVAFTTVDAEDLLKPDQTFGAKVKVGYNSNDSQVNGNVAIYGQPTQHIDFLLAYGARQSDGGEDGHGNHIQGDNIEVDNILAKLSIIPNENHKLTFGYKSLKDEGNYPFRPEFTYAAHQVVGSSLSPKGKIYPGYNNSDEYTLSYKYDPSADFKLDINAYHTEREFMLQGDKGAKHLVVGGTGEIDGISAQAQNNVEFGSSAHKFVYGAEAYQKSSEYLGGYKQEATSYGAYLEDQIDMGRLHLTPGVRYDSYEASQLVGEGEFDKVSGAIAASVDLTDDVSVFGSYTQFFNGPPLPEAIRNKDGGTVFVNKDLEPETGANTEFGISAASNDVLAEGDRVGLVAKVFDTDLTDKISRTKVDCTTGKSGGDCTSYVNADEDITIEGYEIAANYRLDNVLLKVSYDHSETEAVSSRDIRTSGDRFSVGMDYLMDGNYSFGMRYNHVGDVERLDNIRGVGDKFVNYPSYDTFDLYGSYVPTALPDFKLDLGVYNVTDTYYVEHTSAKLFGGDAAEGRNVKVSVTYQF